MKLDVYQIDAFTNEVFKGNPAAVCPLDEWLSDETMIKIAAENNLSETAFYVSNGRDFELRWFTPKMEIDLCGHATLATAFLLFEYMNYQREEIHFQTISGELTVKKKDNLYAMNFPARTPTTTSEPDQLVNILGKSPIEVLESERDLLVLFENEKDIVSMTPDFTIMKELDKSVVIVTARGDKCDFVSRVFAPKLGVVEDPVTGSTHCTLVPYWSKKTQKDEFVARQVSERGGELFCKYLGNRVEIAGNAVVYMKGNIYIPN